MKKRILKNILSLFLVASLIIALPFTQTQTTRATSKNVKIKYIVNEGYFKNTKYKNKKVVTKKVAKDSKRGSSFKVKRENYVFLGWYTKKKGGTKYTSSTKVTKNTKLYARWAKKYKVNEKYSKVLGNMTFTSIKDLESYTGSLKLTKSNWKDYPYTETYKSSNGDLYYLEICITANSTTPYKYYVSNIVAKAKNIVNIKKATKYTKFFKKLGVSKKNAFKKKKKLKFDFVCGISDIVYEDPEDSDWQFLEWELTTDSKKKIKPNTKITLYLTEDWEEY